MQNKTVTDIDNWFNDSIQRQVDVIPPDIIKLAKENSQYLKQVAQSISTKCCFNVKAIEKQLKVILAN